MAWLIRETVPGDADLLAPRLRAEDIREIQASGGDPLDALRSGFTLSSDILTVEDEGLPVIMAGVVPTSDPLVGSVWLLSSDFITNNPIAFLRRSPWFLNSFHRKFPVLANMVHSENMVHVKWLMWMDFHMLREVNVNGEKFYEFARLRHV